MEQKNSNSVHPKFQPLKFKERLGYGLGDLASNIFFQTFIIYLTYFYTDVFGISAAAVATMFLVTRVWDAINDPLMGMISDRTNTKMGKYRPYLLWFAIPIAIVGTLTFTTPGFGESGKLIYAYVTYILLIMLYTAVNVPYSALMGVITADPRERTVLSSYRMIGAYVAGILVQSSVLWLVQKLGGGETQKGWQLTMAVLSGFAAFLFIVTYYSTKERVKPPVNRDSSMKADFKDLLRNRAWLVIGMGSIFQLIFIVMRGSATIYYFKYFVEDVSMNLFGKALDFGFETAASVFMILGTAFSLVSAVFMGWMARKVDKRKSFIILLIIILANFVLFYFLNPENYILMLILQIIASFGIGCISVLQWSIFPDTADYSEWKTGRRATGLVMSASLFAIKFGLAMGGAILGWILTIYNFEPNVEQSVLSLQGIRLSMSLYPALFAFITLVIIWFYPLNQKILDEIEIELENRRNANVE